MARPAPRTLLIACGALAREVLALIELNGWRHMRSHLPAGQAAQPAGADPGGGARQDPRHRGRATSASSCSTATAAPAASSTGCWPRRASSGSTGPHCYAFYRGLDAFLAEADAEPGCFYLTDYPRAPFRAPGDRGPRPRPPSRAAAALLRQLRRSWSTSPRPPIRSSSSRRRRRRCGSASPTSSGRPAMAGSPTSCAGRLIAGHGRADRRLLARHPRPGHRQGRPQERQAPLDDRFQEAIDRAAMRAGLRDTDAYLGEWRRVAAGRCGDDLEAEADAAAARLDADYPPERLRALVANGGRRTRSRGAPA